MQIGIPAEIIAGETRVAATPETVKKFIAAGHSVVIQTGAGIQASVPDADFSAAGATIVNDAASAYASDVILKVRAPETDEIALIKEGAAVVAMFDPFRNPNLAAFAARNLQCFALELLPRTLSRAQNMDVLSSQANLAGYKSVLLAANAYQRLFPMLMTAAGTVKPARIVVLGVGVAGLSAIATAKRLGAIVEASDMRPTAKEQVESLGGKWLDVPMSDEEKAKALGAGGYAWMPSAEYVRDQKVIVDKAVSAADIIITTALIPGRAAPKLVYANTIAKMKAGSVILDMAVESGGNVEGSVCGETVTTSNGVKILGIPNIPGTVAAESSALYARNLLNLMLTLFNKETGALTVNMSDEVHKALLITQAGEVLFAKK